jgi:hypothetical protein
MEKTKIPRCPHEESVCLNPNVECGFVPGDTSPKPGVEALAARTGEMDPSYFLRGERFPRDT